MLLAFAKFITGPLHDPVTWYGINYTGTQITQWDFQNKGKSGWTGASSFVLEVPRRNLRPSVIYSVPCNRIVQRACSINYSNAITGGPYKRRVCFYVRDIKKCIGILKSIDIVNLYRVMSTLKLKINVNLPQVLCIVVSAAQNGEFAERFGGFCVDCYYTS